MITYKLSCFFAWLDLIYWWVKSAGNLMTLFLELQAWVSLRESMVHRLLLTHQPIWLNVDEKVFYIVSFIHCLMIVLDIIKVLRMISVIDWLRILIALRTETLMSIYKHVVVEVLIFDVRSMRWLVYLAIWLLNCLILSVLIVLNSILVVFI